MAQRVVFGLDRMLSVDLPTQSGLRPLRSERTLQRDRVGDIFYEQLGEVAFQYTVRSTAQILSEDSVQTTVADSRRYFSQQSNDVSLSATDRNYLQLPNHLSDRVQALSMQLIQPEQTVLEAAQNVESFLKKTCSIRSIWSATRHWPPSMISYSNSAGATANTLRRLWQYCCERVASQRAW